MQQLQRPDQQQDSDTTIAELNELSTYLDQKHDYTCGWINEKRDGLSKFIKSFGGGPGPNDPTKIITSTTHPGIVADILLWVINNEIMEGSDVV
jgi:hypothetical protein